LSKRLEITFVRGEIKGLIKDLKSLRKLNIRKVKSGVGEGNVSEVGGGE